MVSWARLSGLPPFPESIEKIRLGSDGDVGRRSVIVRQSVTRCSAEAASSSMPCHGGAASEFAWRRERASASAGPAPGFWAFACDGGGGLPVMRYPRLLAHG